MVVRLAKVISVIVAAICLLLVTAYTALPYFLPTIIKEGETKVVGLPEIARNQPLESPFPLAGADQLRLRPDSFPYPIKVGQTGPVQNGFGIPLQYPFHCGLNTGPDRQPLVDNQDGIGMPVYAIDDQGQITDAVVGYSMDCLQPTRVDYYYNRLDTDEFFPLSEARNDIARVVVNGKSVDFIVRLETGTINRFIYGIAAIAGPEEDRVDRKSPPRVDTSNWNRRLVYQFRGGVGIGRQQGKFSPDYIFKRSFDQLAKGYAVAFSTGNHTRNHYNMRLAEDTARRVKRQFVSLYGKPDYTVGIGGSGGAVQQYLIAQNSDDILDAILPVYSYPDMVTQIIHVLDCELLEYYFDVTDGSNPLWTLATNKEKVTGLHANNEVGNIRQQFSQVGAIIQGNLRYDRRGSTECISGWRGLTPLINNPEFYHRRGLYSPSVFAQTHWTHWEDLRFFYGSDAAGYANSFWDNAGVQYGLTALKAGFFDAEQFLRLNRLVGGWKTAAEYEDENYWAMNGSKSLRTFSPWSHQNMTHHGKIPVEIAPRTHGNQEAARAIINSGHVFTGRINVPAIDIRHYLEEELDMHHLSASFATRARIKRAGGNIDNVPIWVAHKDFNPINRAFEVMDQWLVNMTQHPEKTIGENRPKAAVDACFDASGTTLAAGNHVWHGAWNRQPAGPCLEIYPAYQTSRMVAGESIHGDLFKCETIPVDEAIASGTYLPVDMRPWQEQLEEIFPEGVCHYL